MKGQFNLGFVDVGGWDTHVNEGGANGYLAGRLSELGRGLAGFADEIGSDAWNRTVVIVVSALLPSYLTDYLHLSTTDMGFVLGLMTSQRNMGLMLAATGGMLPDFTWLYFAIAQFPVYLSPLLLTPLVLGGDHSIVLGELRAHAAVHGPLGLVLLDAHADTWDQYYGERYFHGTPFRRAVEEGLLEPSRSLLAGMRGPLYGPDDVDQPRDMGFEVIDGDELTTLTPAQYGERVRARIGDGPVYLSFDIDVLDPAFAPGTGTPEVAGLYPREALGFLRALAGISFTGFDLVEVSPPYDAPGQTTALLGAAVAFDMLALHAVTRR